MIFWSALFVGGHDDSEISLTYAILLRGHRLADCTGCGIAVTDPETGLTFGYLETQSNRIFVTVECLYGYKSAITDGIKRIVKP